MTVPGASSSGSWVSQLRRFVSPPALESCEFCRAAIAAKHPHLIELSSRGVVCACPDCAQAQASRAGSPYRLIPQETRRLRDFAISEMQWNAFQIPIDLVFLFVDSAAGRPVAFYPGAAGITQSLLGLDARAELAASNPVLNDLQPDVEALLVNRTNGAHEYYRLPIDRCYGLAGLIRTHWRGCPAAVRSGTISSAISPGSGTTPLLPAGRSAVVDLDFAVDGITVEPFAAIPTLRFALRISNAAPALAVENVMLSCQIRIEPARRPYGAIEHDRLADLFGAPERWEQTLHSFLWTHVNLAVGGFERDCAVALPVPCSFDFNVAATKYFEGLAAGEAPLALLFSGSVFYRDMADRLQIAQIPWSKEVSCALPIGLWRQMMEQYYPDSAWLRLPRPLFDELYRYKRRRALPTFEAALQGLLDTVAAEPAA